MTTLVTESGQLERDLTTARRRIRTLTTLVMVLAVALIAWGAWTVYDISTTSETAVSGDIGQLLDDYIASWNNYDTEAFLGFTTDDFRMTTPDGTYLAGEMATFIAHSRAVNWEIQNPGRPMLVGSGPWTVAIAGKMTADDMAPEGEPGIAVLRIVDQGGTLKVASHFWYTG